MRTDELKELVDIKLFYGSPGYQMPFILREFELSDVGIMLIGDMPNYSVTFDDDPWEGGHFFELKEEELHEFLDNGVLYWTRNGMHNKLSI